MHILRLGRHPHDGEVIAPGPEPVAPQHACLAVRPWPLKPGPDYTCVLAGAVV